MPMLKHNDREVTKIIAYAYVGSSKLVTAVYTCYDKRKVYPTYYQYTLTYSLGTSNITSYAVRRTSSPIAEASIGNLSSGAAIYTGDVLEVSASSASGYYIENNSNRDVTSFTENITVSGNVNIVFRALTKNSLTINTTSTSFATEGKYLWSQTFSNISNAVTDSSSPYYPYVNNSMIDIHGYASSATSTSITFGGWVSSANARVRGTAYYYSSTQAISVSAPRIDDFVPTPFEVTLVNDNSFTVTLQVQGYWESSTGRGEINSWTDIDTLAANGYGTIYPSDMISSSDDDAEMYEIALEFRFAYISGGNTYYSETTYVDL